MNPADMKEQPQGLRRQVSFQQQPWATCLINPPEDDIFEEPPPLVILRDLRPGTMYEFSVKARNPFGWSKYSPIGTAETLSSV